MNNKVDLRRIIIYLIAAFGFSWTGALVIYLTGGLFNSPYLGGFTLAFLILVIVYMNGPAFAHMLTRLVTREGWSHMFLRPRLRHGWPYWLVCWFAPPIFILAGAAVFFVLFPAYFDPTLGTVRKMLEPRPGVQSTSPIDPWPFLVVQTLIAMLIAPPVNAISTFGEEFGWRAYLQPKLMSLGGRTAVLLTGLIWGAWHAPVIVMGYNYGFDYPGAPWLGIFVMMWFTVMLGTLLGWASLRGGSVWPAVIGHGAFNGMVSIVTLVVQGRPNMLLGPFGIGLIGSIGFAVVALVLFLVPGALAAPSAPASIGPVIQPVAASSDSIGAAARGGIGS